MNPYYNLVIQLLRTGMKQDGSPIFGLNHDMLNLVLSKLKKSDFPYVYGDIHAKMITDRGDRSIQPMVIKQIRINVGRFHLTAEIKNNTQITQMMKEIMTPDGSILIRLTMMDLRFKDPEWQEWYNSHDPFVVAYNNDNQHPKWKQWLRETDEAIDNKEHRFEIGSPSIPESTEVWIPLIDGTFELYHEDKIVLFI